MVAWGWLEEIWALLGCFCCVVLCFLCVFFFCWSFYGMCLRDLSGARLVCSCVCVVVFGVYKLGEWGVVGWCVWCALCGLAVVLPRVLVVVDLCCFG